MNKKKVKRLLIRILTGIAITGVTFIIVTTEVKEYKKREAVNREIRRHIIKYRMDHQKGLETYRRNKNIRRSRHSM